MGVYHAVRGNSRHFDVPVFCQTYPNSFSSAAEITRAISTWYFAGSYLRFSACYVDENNTIRFSEKFPIDTYNKMSTL